MSSDKVHILKQGEIEEITAFNLRIHPLRLDEFLSLIESGLEVGKSIAQFGINSATVNDTAKNSELRGIINSVDLIHIDGMSVVWALKFLGFRIPERVATPDLADAILELAARKRLKIFLFGAREEILILCRQNIEKKYPGLIIAGYRNGYYKTEEEMEIVDQINATDPDILFLGISSPKKEQFFNTYREKLNAGYILGVGGYFDILAGLLKRAPLWMQNSGFEWLYRLIQEPRRLWKRYLLGFFRFSRLIIRERFGKRKK